MAMEVAVEYVSDDTTAEYAQRMQDSWRLIAEAYGMPAEDSNEVLLQLAADRLAEAKGNAMKFLDQAVAKGQVSDTELEWFTLEESYRALRASQDHREGAADNVVKTLAFLALGDARDDMALQLIDNMTQTVRGGQNYFAAIDVHRWIRASAQRKRDAQAALASAQA